MERALWKSFGRRPDEMTFLEFQTKATILRVEAEHASKKRT